MTIPLYVELQTEPPEITNKGNRGLWFERFFDQYKDQQQWANPKPETAANAAWLKNHFNENANRVVGDSKQLATHAQTQIQLVTGLQGQSHIFKASWHFVTGTGNPHPVENGFAWHPTLGVPYLTGAAVKGLVRTLIETQLDESDLTNPDKKELLLQWFGSDHKDPKEQTYDSKAGDLIFFDAIPTEPVTLGVDIMTPHMGKWYEKGGTAQAVGTAEAVPADWHDPTPISFLVAKDIKLLFSFAIRSHPPTEKPPFRKLELNEVTQVLEAVLTHMGAGGKTATGYGGMHHDEATEKALSQQIEKARIEQEKEAELQAALATLSPTAAEFKKQAVENKWDENKDAFAKPGVIEGWLDKLEAEPDAAVVDRLVKLVEKHFPNLLANPMAVEGKKKQPVFKERQQKIGKRLNSLRT